jgi:hypothetical protein
VSGEGHGSVKVRAYSPGRFPILIVEISPGELRALYHETGYNPDHSKPVGEDWLVENALGRHSFVAVNPPEEMPVPDLADFARRAAR